MTHKNTLFKTYLENLRNIIRTGDAREESFYPALANLIWDVAKATGRAEVQVTILPRPTEAGNPDFRVWDGTSRIVGYMEAKPPTEELLDRVEASEQLQRYRDTFPNLILTNFLEFRLYRNGQRVATAQLGRSFVLTALEETPPLENSDAVWDLLDQFLDFSLPRPLTAENLAVELAKRTRFLRDVVRQQLDHETAIGNGHLLGFYEAFQKYLIGTLAPEEFADLYAQTITYGLFAARTRATNGFSRRAAFDYIPHTIGVLRDLFRFISLGDLPEEMAWIVDDIAEVLAVADVNQMMIRYYREGRGSDPVVHFYETFLAHYDPEERERRGVYYTPDPVVSYIVRSLHRLLKSRFGLPDGLASREVTLLDPAAGTMTFGARAAEQAVREFTEKYGTGGREAFIRNHILRNFYAFELMMAPYAVGHLKMGFFLEELGHRLQEDERIPFYLTNTLDMSELEASKLPGLSSLAEESHLAGQVKREQPILVILGNPPYSGHSANKGEWILRQIETYKKVDGKPLGEKNPKWLQDDYVKFIRFAQWKIDQTGRGVIGMITNHSYLDNPTFRGMRCSLMRTFDEIYILDLHGNSLKRERCPDGSPDENVFDIRQGVAIALFVKTGEEKTPVIRHADVWGTREHKYAWLEAHDVENTSWQEIHPRPRFYLFVPRDEAELERYNTFPGVTEIFEKYSVGIVTARDRLTIHWIPEEVWTTALNFSRMDPELARKAYRLGKDARDWKVTLAQQDLRDSGPDRDKVVPILYRPFDVRYTYYTGRSRGFICMPRPEVMRHMLAGENVALIVPRRVEHVGSWQHALVSEDISEHVVVSLKTIDYHFPLYLYPDAEPQTLFSALEPQERRPNIKPWVFERLTEAYGQRPTPEDLFHYIYAVLYAPSYREKYADFLRLDFPRIPFPAEREVFDALADLGKRLVDLHLLHSSELDPPLARFEGQGDNRVGKGKSYGFRYEPETERVYINRTQYFAPVPLEVWEYTIGGYQVCHKWLKDRRERQLTLDEIRTYCRIVTAIARTIEIQEEIDEVYSQVERAVLDFAGQQAHSA
ncbi:MAG TPA: DNA methyltransferase [Anaerolineae bacterium]|nr:DNA methyltransferase [Anaerolineae bacterium]